MLTHSAPRNPRRVLAGCGATLLAALAIAAPASAAEIVPGSTSSADQVGLNFAHVAQDFHFRPGG